jgi:hypothetical protein
MTIPGRAGSQANALRIVNSTPDPVHVTLNPWPRFFTLLPSGGFELRHRTESRSYLEVDVDDQGLWVFAAYGGVACLVAGGAPEVLPAVAAPDLARAGSLTGSHGRTAELVDPSVGMYVCDDRSGSERIVVTESERARAEHRLPERGIAHRWAVATGWPGRPPVLEVHARTVHVIGREVEID